MRALQTNQKCNSAKHAGSTTLQHIAIGSPQAEQQEILTNRINNQHLRLSLQTRDTTEERIAL